MVKFFGRGTIYGMNSTMVIKIAVAGFLCIYLWTIFPVLMFAHNIKRKGRIWKKILWSIAIAVFGPFTAPIYGLTKARGIWITAQSILCVLTIYGAIVGSLLSYNNLRNKIFENLEVISPQVKTLPDTISVEMKTKLESDLAAISKEAEEFKWWDYQRILAYYLLVDHIKAWLSDGNISLEEFTEWNTLFVARKSFDLKRSLKDFKNRFTQAPDNQ